MSDDNGTKSLVKAEPKPDLGIQEFGSREDIAALGNRIRAMMPGGEKLTNQQAMATAQYALTLGANPFRGEIYAYEDRGQLQIVEGYKLLVRWAKAKCDYSEWYEVLDGLDEGDIGFRCFILRQDKHELLQTFLERGMELDRAMDIVTVSAGGVVRAAEMTYSRDSKWHKKGEPLDPPTGWTWEDVAKKRALKNTLNKSHGVPSLADIAKESWNVHGTQTQAEDWEDVRAEMLPAEAEATAEYNAQLRRIHEGEPTVENAAQAAADLFGDAAIEEGQFEEPDEEGEPEELEEERYLWTLDEAKRFFHHTREILAMADEDVLQALGGIESMSACHLPYEKAVEKVEAWCSEQSDADALDDAEQIPFFAEDDAEAVEK